MEGYAGTPSDRCSAELEIAGIISVIGVALLVCKSWEE